MKLGKLFSKYKSFDKITKKNITHFQKAKTYSNQNGIIIIPYYKIHSKISTKK